MKSLSGIVAAVTLCAASSTMAQNIVQNSGFEDGLANWTTGNMYVEPNDYAHTGSSIAGSTCVGHSCVNTQGSGAYIAQTLNTVAGSSYNLGLWVSEAGYATSEMAIYWNGALVANVVNPANNNYLNWVQFNYNNLVATGSATVLEIHGRHDPAAIFFDDISVTAAVPEPSSYAMLMAGLGALSLIAKRRRS